jgi:membrane fusion protein (multidrug efflux system)
VELVSEIDSKIRELKFKEGDRVKKGQALITLEDTRVKANLDDATARLELANAELKRGDELLANKTITEQEIDRLRFQQRSADAAMRTARRQFEEAVISSPFDGVMAEHDLSPGQNVARGEKLVWVIQTSPLEVEFHVPERYIAQVAKAQKIQIESVALPGRKFEGSVDYISPRLDEASRTGLVKARIPNEEGLLKPGMYGSLDLIFRVRDKVLTIPEACLSYHGDHASVVVMNQAGKAEFREVKVGLRLQEKAEVLEGLVEGELVVVEGYQKMGPGTTVLISPESVRYGILPPPVPAPAEAAPAVPAAGKS